MSQDQFTVERENESVAQTCIRAGERCFYHYQSSCDWHSGYTGFSLFPELHLVFLVITPLGSLCHAELGKIPAGQPISKQGEDRLHLQV
jgi:hypothetical protein